MEGCRRGGRKIAWAKFTTPHFFSASPHLSHRTTLQPQSIAALGLTFLHQTEPRNLSHQHQRRRPQQHATQPTSSPYISTMSLSCQFAARSAVRSLRAAGGVRTAAIAQRRWNSEAAAPANPKIAQIVDQISTLTLLETADLVASLKVSYFR